MKVHSIVMAPLLLLALAAAPFAVAAEGAGKDAKETKRLQMKLHKLEQEKSQLEQEQSALAEKLKGAEGASAKAQQHAQAAERRATQLGRELETLKQERDILKGQLAETESRLQGERQAHDNDNRHHETQRLKLTAAASACSERNGRMYTLGQQLVSRYESKSCLTSALQAEPFTGLARARIEAMAEEDRALLDDLRLPAETRTSGN